MSGEALDFKWLNNHRLKQIRLDWDSFFFLFFLSPTRAHRHSRAPQTRQAFAECVILDCTTPLKQSQSLIFHSALLPGSPATNFALLPSDDETVRTLWFDANNSEYCSIYISLSLHSTIFSFSFLFPSFSFLYPFRWTI